MKRIIVLMALAGTLGACSFRESKLGGTTGSSTGASTTSTGSTTSATSPTTGGTTTGTTSGTPVTFTQVKAQIFTPKCLGCHGSGGNSPDLSSAAFASDPTYVVAGHPESSAIVAAVQSGSMPRGGTPLSAAEITLLSTWIEQGALNN